MTDLLLETSVCTPLRRLLLIKPLLLTTSLMGQLQAIVKSDWSLTHTAPWETSTSDSVIQGTDYYCSVWPSACILHSSSKDRSPTMFITMFCVKDQKHDPEIRSPQRTFTMSQTLLKRLLTDSHSLSFFWALSKSKFTYRHSTNSVIGSL